MTSLRTGARVRAPEIAGGDWVNTDRPPALRDLRGRFVLLDFWTSCCGNCLHVLDELREVETALADVLTVVGIHSAKFAHEREFATVIAAVERNQIAHPVRSDPDLALWRQYAVRAWPTLVLVDPEGYVIAQAAGEGQASALAAIVNDLVPEYERRGALRRGSFDVDRPVDGGPNRPLHFPARAIVLPRERTGRADDTLLVADPGSPQLIETASDGVTVLRRIGSGRRGAPFTGPMSVALLPADLGAGYDVVVADTGAHVLRGVRLSDGAVVTTVDLSAALDGTRTITGAIPRVFSPWDVAWWPARSALVVAAAGVHLLLCVDPLDGSATLLAGTTVEGLRDGPALDAWLAQPSGVAVDGERVWFVDAETSALRWYEAGEIGTAVGAGLFDFGHVDGPARAARLQHPLGVVLLADGSLAVADTYNGALRRYDPRTHEVTTLAGGLAEPSGVVVDRGGVLVVESAAGRITRIDTAAGAVGAHRDHEAMSLERPPAILAAGELSLEIDFRAPPGRTLDDRYGPATSLTVSASPPQLLVAGAGSGTQLSRVLALAPGSAVLHISAQAASCDDDSAEHPACYLARQDWGIPVVIGSDGDTVLRLPLLS